MRFIFDCEDEILLPATYYLAEEIKPFIEKMKQVEVDEKEISGDRKKVFKKIVENMMVKHPAETSKVLSRLWVLEEDEKAPNALKTMAALFSSEAAIDFFTSALPSLLVMLNVASPLLKSKK
jgi:translation elongation factor EF-Ts